MDLQQSETLREPRTVKGVFHASMGQAQGAHDALKGGRTVKVENQDLVVRTARCRHLLDSLVDVRPSYEAALACRDVAACDVTE